MPILHNPQGRTLYVLRRKSTGEIIGRNKLYPNIDETATIVGLDPDLEYLPMDQDVQPDYDPRYFSIATSEDKEGSNWHIQWVTTKRSVDEIKQAIQNAKNLEISKIIPSVDKDEMLVLALGVLFRLTKGLSLTEQEKAVQARVEKANSVLQQNLAIASDKEAAVIANAEPDLDVWADVP